VNVECTYTVHFKHWLSRYLYHRSCFYSWIVRLSFHRKHSVRLKCTKLIFIGLGYALFPLGSLRCTFRLIWLAGEGIFSRHFPPSHSTHLVLGALTFTLLILMTDWCYCLWLRVTMISHMVILPSPSDWCHVSS